MDQKVGVYFWFRVVVMIFTLVGVLTIMYRLRGPNALGGAASYSVNLCPTRVSSVSKIGSFAVLQDGMRWYRTEEGTRTELDPIAVEKWFGEHCMIKADKIEANEGATPLFTLAYISGLPKTILMNPDGIFTLEGSHFRSLQLAQAIVDLENLPILTKPGQNNSK